MRKVEKVRRPITVDVSALSMTEEQLRSRLSLMIIGQIDSYLLGALDQYVAGRVGAVLEAHCARTAAAEGLLAGEATQPAMGRFQQALAARFDRQGLDATIDALVQRRVDELFNVATSSVPEPTRALDLRGVPTMTTEEALREARGPAGDPRLGALAGGVDVDDED